MLSCVRMCVCAWLAVGVVTFSSIWFAAKQDCDLAGYERKGCGPINRVCGGSAGLVGITRAAVYPMRNYVYGLVVTSFRLIIPLSLPGRSVTTSSSTTFSSVHEGCRGVKI